MEILSFDIEIHASTEKVWKALWEEDSYKKWTAIFSEGSYAVSDWNEGSKIYFLSKEGDGMNSIIVTKIPNKHMAFKHVGVMKDGKEVPNTDEVNSWAGAMEEYFLDEELNHATLLTVKMDVTDEFKDYFIETFPKALNEVKKLAETK